MFETVWIVFLSTQLKTLVAVCLVLVTFSIIRRMSTAERLFVLKLLFGLLLLLPFLNWLPDALQIDTNLHQFTDLDRFSNTIINTGVVKSTKLSIVATSWPEIFIVGYFLISGILLIRLLWKWLATNKQVGSLSAIEDSNLTNLLNQLLSQLNIDKAVTLVFGPNHGMPYAWSLGKSTIVLPRQVLSWSRSQQRSVLSHELIHIQRHDLFICLVAEIACRLYWINPLVWLMARRLRHELECSCDDCAVDSGLSATDYAEHLINVAKQSAQDTYICQNKLTMAGRSQLTSRIKLLMKSNIRRGPMNRGTSIGIIFTFLLVALPVIAAKDDDGNRGKLIYSDDYNQQEATIDLQKFFDAFENQIPESFTAYTITVFPDQLLIALSQDAKLPKNVTMPQAAAILRWLDSSPEMHNTELISMNIEDDIGYWKIRTYFEK